MDCLLKGDQSQPRKANQKGSIFYHSDRESQAPKQNTAFFSIHQVQDSGHAKIPGAQLDNLGLTGYLRFSCGIPLPVPWLGVDYLATREYWTAVLLHLKMKLTLERFRREASDMFLQLLWSKTLRVPFLTPHRGFVEPRFLHSKHRDFNTHFTSWYFKRKYLIVENNRMVRGVAWETEDSCRPQISWLFLCGFITDT